MVGTNNHWMSQIRESLSSSLVIFSVISSKRYFWRPKRRNKLPDRPRRSIETIASFDQWSLTKENYWKQWYQHKKPIANHWWQWSDCRKNIQWWWSSQKPLKMSNGLQNHWKCQWSLKNNWTWQWSPQIIEIHNVSITVCNVSIDRGPTDVYLCGLLWICIWKKHKPFHHSKN